METFIFTDFGETHLGYRVEIIGEEAIGDWRAIIDSHTGKLLELKDVAIYYHKEKHVDLPKRNNPPEVSFLEDEVMIVDGSGFVFEPDPLSATQTHMADYMPIIVMRLMPK